MAALKRKAGSEPLTFFGLGGDSLAAQGTVLMMHNREFSVGGGPREILSKLPKRRQLELQLEKRLFERRPDGAILIDNGEINLRLASLLRFFGVPVVYFIPPKVWAWRMSRIEKIAQHVNLVLSILPFEKPLYDEWNIPFKYVGNPLLDEVPLDLSQSEAKQRLGIASDRDVLTIMPGSRHNEVRHHVEVFSAGVRKFFEQQQLKQLPIVAIPAAQAIDADALAQSFRSRLSEVEVIVAKGKSHECLKAARVAIVKSGTSTLEAALLQTPMILAYATSRSSVWLYKHVVRYRGFVGLVNLFLADSPTEALGWEKTRAEPVVPEVFLDACTPENIARELAKIYSDGPAREKMLAMLSKTRERLQPPIDLGSSPSQAAAEATWQLFSAARGKTGV